MHLKRVANVLLQPRKTTVFDKMLDILIALVPTAIAGCIYFGYNSVMLIFCCIAAAVAAEWICARLLHVEGNVKNLSAVVTGLLIALGQSPSMPVWAAMACTVLAVVVARMFFGGNGCEIVNPAALGIVLSRLSFPILAGSLNDAFSHMETTLSPLNAPEGTFTVKQLLFGAHSGAIGEVGSLFLLLGALYVFVRRVHSPTVPLLAVVGAVLTSLIFSVDLSVILLGSGLLLGSVFMAPDRTTSPHNISGQLVYGFLIGVIAVLIYRFGGEEGVYYAILFMNLLRPLCSAIPDFNLKEAE